MPTFSSLQFTCDLWQYDYLFEEISWRETYFESYDQCRNEVYDVVYRTCTKSSRSFLDYEFDAWENRTYIYDKLYLSLDNSSHLYYSLYVSGPELNFSIFGPCVSCSDGARMLSNLTCVFFQDRPPYLCSKSIPKYSNWLDWIGIAFGNMFLMFTLCVTLFTLTFRFVKICALRRQQTKETL